MPVFSKVKVDCKIAGDSGLLSPKASVVIDEKVGDKFTVESSARLSLAGGATDVAFDFQSVVTGKFVLIECAVATGVDVKVNGTGNAAMRIIPTTTEDAVSVPGFLLLLADNITSLHFSNPDGSNAIDVDVGVAGLTT